MLRLGSVNEVATYLKFDGLLDQGYMGYYKHEDAEVRYGSLSS
jgi:hypothetical protein